MKQHKIIISAVSGTTIMTLVSYLLSWISNSNFKEPKILSLLIIRLFKLPKNAYSRLTGWCLHYLVGLLFAELYAPIWENIPPRQRVKTGLVLGGISGFAAILVWKFTLAVHPNPPSLNFMAFALQLFVVHLIFGTAAAIGYNFS